MAGAKYLAEQWTAICNRERPDRSLGGAMPKRYWKTWAREKQLAITETLD